MALFQMLSVGLRGIVIVQGSHRQATAKLGLLIAFARLLDQIYMAVGQNQDPWLTYLEGRATWWTRVPGDKHQPHIHLFSSSSILLPPQSLAHKWEKGGQCVYGRKGHVNGHIESKR